METSEASDLGVDRRRVEGAGRLPRTPRRTGPRADDSNHPPPEHLVARNRSPVARTGTRLRGRNNHPANHSNRHTGCRDHLSVRRRTEGPGRPGTGGSGLDLSGKGLHVGPDLPVHAVVAAAGAGIAVAAAAAAGERAAAGARAAAAARTAAKAGTAAAEGKAAATGTTAAAVGTSAAAGTMTAAAGKAAAADTKAAAAGTSATAGLAAAAAGGAAAEARSAAADTAVAAGASAAVAAAASGRVAGEEHIPRPVAVRGRLLEPSRLDGRWAPVYQADLDPRVYLYTP